MCEIYTYYDNENDIKSNKCLYWMLKSNFYPSNILKKWFFEF